MGLESASYIDDLVSSNPTSDDPVSSGDDHLRLIKAVLLASLGGVDGPVEAGVGNGLASAAELSALFDRLDSLEGSAGSGIVGEVRAFYGDTDDIPAGWFLCDGTDGTPDMRGRYLIGGNESPADGLPLYEGATTGGALPGSQTTGPAGGHSHTVTIDDHTLTTANLPAHSHKMFDTNEGPTTNNQTNKPGADDAVAWEAPGDRDYRLNRYGGGTATIGQTGETGSASAVAHTNAVTNTVAPHTHTLSGSSLPPWHAVHWIMYLGAS